MILSESNDIQILYDIKNLLKDDFYKIEVREAKIPIITGIYNHINIHVDISLNQKNSVESSIKINEIISKEEKLKPVIIFLKILLKRYKMNKTFGGDKSSFLLFNLVFYLYKTKNYENDNVLNIIIDFLSFYMNFENNKYSLFVEESSCKKVGENNNRLKVISFLTENNDIGFKCSNFKKIKDMFFGVYSNIMNNQNEISLLTILDFPKKNRL